MSLTKRVATPITSAAASRKRRPRAAKEAPVSPTTESLKLPTHLALQPRQPHPLTTEEAMVVRDREGRVLARIDALRADLLPN